MPVPWAQIVRLMPSILELSHELLRRARRPVSAGAPDPSSDAGARAELQSRVLALEDNERRQAELVNEMAGQLAQLTAAVTALHRQTRVLLVGLIVIAIIAVTALVRVLR